MQDLMMKHIDEKHPLYSSLHALGIPNTKTEQYKNFPIKTILSRDYNFEEFSDFEALEGTRLVIENGIVKEFPKGAKVYLEKEFSVDEEHFDALYYMSHILAPKTILIELNESLTFELEHLFSGEGNLFDYRMVFEIAENVKVDIFESFTTHQSQNCLLLYGVDIDVAPKSTLAWIRNEKLGEDGLSILGTHRYKVQKQGALELKSFDFGTIDMLHLYKIDLDNYAWVDASHLLLANKDSRRGNIVQINHNEPYAKSVQEARTILSENATGIFDAKIRVGHDAAYSNASQNSKAILLDTNAHMYAKPQLEIYTDELEASHGSSIGSLDEEALFYLCSRGISKEDARKILVSSFANTLIDTIDNEKYVQIIRDDFEKSYKTKDMS